MGLKLKVKNLNYQNKRAGKTYRGLTPVVVKARGSLAALMILVLVFSLLPFDSYRNTASAAATNINTSTSPSATANSSQRKTFYDTVNSKYWGFYCNGSAIEYSYSADGSSWTSAGTSAYNTADFAVSFKDISGTGYVFLATNAGSGYDVVVRKGTLSATSISWGSEYTALDGDSANNTYEKPAITLDSSNYIWVAARRKTGSSGTIGYVYQAYVRRSTNANDVSAWNSSTALDNKTNQLDSLALVSRTSQKMYLIIGNNSNNIIGYSYNGSSWSKANSGGDYSWFQFCNSALNNTVNAIAISGTDIYAGGDFLNAGGDANADRIAKWNGTSWSALGSGLSSSVNAIAISGTDIYVGGSFADAGGIAAADRIAKWNGTSWSALGSGLSSSVNAIAISGTDVYAGGDFLNAGGDANADRIAKWNGTSWSALGSGLSSTVRAIAISGTDVYAGGYFANAGGIAAANYIAKWNGTSWSALGSGLSSAVRAIAISGTDVYAGGDFLDAGGDANADRIAKWNGTSWSALGSTALNNLVYAIAVSGTDVYAGGYFTDAGGVAAADYIAKWNGSAWSALGSGSSGAPYTIAISGTDVYAGGVFSSAGGIAATDYIAKWNGTSWLALGSGTNGLNSYPYAIAISGTDVYVGGNFTDAGGIAAADYIAKWNGTSWSALGSGLSSTVYAIAISGTDIYVGGWFLDAGGIAAADYIAKWNGSAWSALGSGLGSSVYAIAISGTDIYAGGDFLDAGGIAEADYIAKWNGSSWSALASGLGSTVRAIAISGTDVYVGGNFTDAGGIAAADYIAKWNGTSWSALGSGLGNIVRAIAISGTDIYAGGEFLDAGGIAAADRIAKWNGTSWSALGSGLSSSVYAIAISGTDIYAGGNFLNAGGIAEADYIAKWNGSSWSALGTGLSSTVYAIAISGTDSYVGGGFSLAGDKLSSRFAIYGPAISAGTDANQDISAVADSNDNVHLIYKSSESGKVGYIRYKKWDGSSWSTTVDLDANAGNNYPTVSVLGADLYAFWVRSNTIYYKKGVSPYASSNWDTSATTFYNTGTNAYVTSSYTGAHGTVFAIWTEGSASLYNVKFDKTPSTIWTHTTSAATLAPPSVHPVLGNAFIGGNDNYVRGMSTTNGVQAWTPVSTGGAIQSRSPVLNISISGTPTYVIYSSSSDGYLHAINASSGTALSGWPKNIGTALQGGIAAQKNLTISGQDETNTDDWVLFIGTYDNVNHASNKFYALDAVSGATLWTQQSINLDFVSGSPCVDSSINTVYFTSYDNSGAQSSLWAINTADGTVRWSRALGNISSSPTKSTEGPNNYIYVGTNAGYLYKYLSQTTEPTGAGPNDSTWRFDATAGGVIYGYPWYSSGGKIYFSTTTQGRVYCLNNDGTANTSFGSPNGYVTVTSPSAPLVNSSIGSGKLYVGSTDGKIHELGLSDGVESASSNIGSTVGSPTYDYVRGYLYVGATDGKIYSFNVASGL